MFDHSLEAKLRLSYRDSSGVEDMNNPENSDTDSSRRSRKRTRRKLNLEVAIIPFLADYTLKQTVSIKHDNNKRFVDKSQEPGI